jgi:hypothetical protein
MISRLDKEAKRLGVPRQSVIKNLDRREAAGRPTAKFANVDMSIFRVENKNK